MLSYSRKKGPVHKHDMRIKPITLIFWKVSGTNALEMTPAFLKLFAVVSTGT
jgi:hypothetical protein